MPEIVQDIGAYAGLASVVGLAVLSALYFSQARDVKRLREWAGRAPERAGQGAPTVPGRVTAQPQQAAAGARPAVPPVPGAPAAPAPAGGQPGGPGAPRPGAAPGGPQPGAPRPGAAPGGPQPGAPGGPQPGPDPGGPRPAAPVLPGAAPATAAAASGRPAAATAAGARPATATAGGPATEGAGSEFDQTAAEQGAGVATEEPAPAHAGNEAGAATGTPGNEAGAAAPAPAGNAAAASPSAPGAAPASGGDRDGDGESEASAGDRAPQPGAPAPPQPGAPAAATAAGAAGAAATNSKGATHAPGGGIGARPAAPPVPGLRPPGRPGGPSRPGQATAVFAPPRKDPWYRRLTANPLYVVLAIAGVLIVGGAAAFGVTQLVSDDGGGTPGSGQPVAQEPAGGDGESGDRQRRRRGGGGVNPANVTVAVLNGTTVPGLAATIMDNAEEAGFRPGTVANFIPNQQLAESVVQYTPGHEREAAVVSRRLRIPQREAVNPSSQELAGDATVVVLVGADKAP